MVSNVRLDSVHNYFKFVVRPNFEDHFGNIGDLRTATNLANSLHSVRDWLLESPKSEMTSRFGEIAGSKDFQNKLEKECPSLALISDIANATKHMTLLIKRKRTKMSGASNLKPRGFGEGSYGKGSYGGPDIIIQMNNEAIFFDKTAKSVFSYWKNLLNELET
ncbi:MAG: hypothetical protein Q9M48_03610 [Rhodobacterales bacterium]|nr:hypothetical protein [Rhodobacterales bacterium]